MEFSSQSMHTFQAMGKLCKTISERRWIERRDSDQKKGTAAMVATNNAECEKNSTFSNELDSSDEHCVCSTVCVGEHLLRVQAGNSIVAQLQMDIPKARRKKGLEVLAESNFSEHYSANEKLRNEVNRKTLWQDLQTGVNSENEPAGDSSVQD